MPTANVVMMHCVQGGDGSPQCKVIHPPLCKTDKDCESGYKCEEGICKGPDGAVSISHLTLTQK
jgi:hypothetical protein